ncbi:MAG TPA: hypothetical protein VFS00_17790 [Polyangiaceae bacterium]|nr:hypothetical protein [Polyangiaceae bacterium]
MSRSYCPHCRQDAPVIVRDLGARCVACGHQRPPFGQTALNLAGRPSQVGGSLARGFGYALGSFALLFSALVAWALQALWPQGIAGYVVAGPMAALGLVLATLLVRGGSSLRRTGEQTEREAKERAVWALAARAGGSVTVPDVARALGLSSSAADAFLTSWAERDVDQLRLEVDDRGRLLYQFPSLLPAPAARPAHRAGAPVRVAPPASAATAAPPAPKVRFAPDANGASAAALDDAAEAEALAEARAADRGRASS